MSKTSSAKVNLAISAIIFGTLGLFSKNISMPATVITMIRGLVAAPFLLLVLLAARKKMDGAAIRKNLPRLCFCFGEGCIKLSRKIQLVCLHTADLWQGRDRLLGLLFYIFYGCAGLLYKVRDQSILLGYKGIQQMDLFDLLISVFQGN